jgi:putative ABC transport system ATP-binding protein
MFTREPLVSVRNVTKTYGEGRMTFRALNEVDLDVDRGELVLLMGPSGSGKTTLLSIIGGILRPTSGVVRLLGRDISSLDERDLPSVRLGHIGFVFQGFNLFLALTASQNVELAFHLKGVSRRDARRRAADLLDLVALSDKRDAYPSDLSGGQKQRVAIARALAGDPSIILADEPTASLDWHNGLALMQLLQELAHARERAVILVTHDSRIVKFADRIVKIEDGRIVDQRNIKERTLQTHLLSRTEASLDADTHTLAASSRLERS